VMAEVTAALERTVVAKGLNLHDFEWTAAVLLYELAMVAILNLAGFEQTVAGLCGLMMVAILCGLAVSVLLNLAVLLCVAAARLCVLEAQVVVAGLKLGRFEWTVAKQCLVSFQLVVVIMQAEAVLEVEAGGVAQSEAGVALPCHRHHRKTSHHCLS